MRFMMLMIPKGYESAEAGAMPSAEAVAAMMKYNESLNNPGPLPRRGHRVGQTLPCRSE